jgi:hypothetical protein
MKNHNSEKGTTFRSLRHRGGDSIETEHAAPERAVENSLRGAKGAIARERLPVDEHKATTFRPSKEAEAGDRIGSDHRVGAGQPNTKATAPGGKEK